MKKMRIEGHGWTEWLEMTEENMDEIITDYYPLDVSVIPLWSDSWEEWVQPGEEFYWVDEDPIPAYFDAMEWIIEEVIQLRTDDFEDE